MSKDTVPVGPKDILYIRPLDQNQETKQVYQIYRDKHREAAT